jgi:hypothetical protein
MNSGKVKLFQKFESLLTGGEGTVRCTAACSSGKPSRVRQVAPAQLIELTQVATARPLSRSHERELAAATSIAFTSIERGRAAHWIRAVPVARVAV